MIRQAAFTGKMPLLKGALHCHTTRSDGKGTPEETMRLHKANGYDFVALTDHRNYNFKNFAPETGLIVVPGMEMDRSIPGQPAYTVSTPWCSAAKRTREILTSRISASKAARYPARKNSSPCSMNTTATVRSRSTAIRNGAAHPRGNSEKMRGNFAMEIWNSGCVLENGMDTNAAWWDEILMQGQKLYGCATDDGHSMDQHCKGWVCVNAEKNVDSILEGLSTRRVLLLYRPGDQGFLHRKRRGDGGLFALRGDRVPWRPIPLQARIRRRRQADARDLPLPGGMQYLRVTVMDAQGRRAWTNPIFDFA